MALLDFFARKAMPGLHGIFAMLLFLYFLSFAILSPALVEAAKHRKATETVVNVYEKQPVVTDKELLAFLELLPQFRAWAREKGEHARPVSRNGKADFAFSKNAAGWVTAKGWNPTRFFCVMGRIAAALAIVEEGNTMRHSRPGDMPEVSEQELELARRHLGSLLKVSAPPIDK